MIKRMLAILAVAWLGGCSACEELFALVEAPESHVTLPTTIDEVRAFVPEGATFSKARMTKPADARGCTRSPLCLIVVPVMIGDAQIPSTFDLVTVRRADVVLYQGLFDLRGRLVHGRVRGDAEWHEITRITLTELGESPILETATVAIRADGSDGERRRVPLLPQIDLVARYERVLGHEEDADDRADLVLEAVRVLEDEALSFVRARAAGGRMDDDERWELLRALDAAALPDARRRAIVEAIAQRPGRRSAAWLLPSTDFGPLSEAGKTRTAAALLTALCTEGPRPTEHRAFDVLIATPPLRTRGLAAMPTSACTPTRRALVGALVGDDVPDAEILHALVTDEGASAYAREVARGKPEVGDTLLGTHPETRDPRVIEAAIFDPVGATRLTTLTRARALAEAYVHPRTTPRERFAILGRFAGTDATILEAARPPLDTAHTRASGDARALVATALVATGDGRFFEEPIALLAPNAPLAYALTASSGDPTKAQLAYAGYAASGCSLEDVLRMAQATRARARVVHCGGARP